MDCDSKYISGEFTVNFFDESNLAELDEIPRSFYEVLKLPLITDYLDHKAQLLWTYKLLQKQKSYIE